MLSCAHVRTMGTQNRMKAESLVLPGLFSFPLRTASQVHSRDLAKLRHTVGLMEELKLLGGVEERPKNVGVNVVKPMNGV